LNFLSNDLMILSGDKLSDLTLKNGDSIQKTIF